VQGGSIFPEKFGYTPGAEVYRLGEKPDCVKSKTHVPLPCAGGGMQIPLHVAW
jgi:hypothetical protein